MNNTVVSIDQRIRKLKEARQQNAIEIRNLEERTMVINDELERLLVRKGELIVQERMQQYFKDEQ
jgi:hypothetical protein